ncbi:hypothetical protein KAR91_35970 [Candidatus Pacearchaeota archaeon]|nr:hypothetical protein [Candidatus Pacearchaeota archaeon]
MSNNLNTNPIVLDTFSATVTLRKRSVGGLTIKKIVFRSADGGDVFALEDESGNQIVLMKQKVALTSELDFGPRGQSFSEGVVFDHDDALQAGLGSGDYVFIYLL